MKIFSVLYFLHTFISVRANDVLGCGGFIKSHVQIDFSRVEVKLYTKQGILKDKTTCAPNNGYYFIPLYDKGEYVIQLDPPAGWSFTPTKVPLIVDGSDLCSEGKDINFVFKGFGITGKVESLGHDGFGPSGIKVELKSDAEVRSTVTGAGGSFFFTPVYPGKYSVTISHPKWKLMKNSIAVQVTEGNTDLPPKSLIVIGYDVTGSVKSENQGVSGVNIVLFKHNDNHNHIKVEGCDTTMLEGFKSETKQLCHVTSNEQGIFTFPIVSSGKYFIVPHYRGQNNHFVPTKLEFTVEDGSLHLSEPFEIVGFGVHGRILSSENGKPLNKAKIIVNGKEISITGPDGKYTLEKLKAGAININVQAENYLFEEKSLKVNPSVAQLPDLIPSKYKVCGTVLSDKSHQVSISADGTLWAVTNSDASNGEFCEYLVPGKFEIRVSVNVLDKDEGVQFFPVSQTVEVKTGPIFGITFSQLRATIKGQVHCFKEQHCATLKVALRPKSGSSLTGNKEIIADVKGGQYMFEDIRPGLYEVELLNNKLCWIESKHVLTVNTIKQDVPPFKQNGYAVVFTSSHDTEASYELLNKQSKPQLINIKQGSMSYCVEKPGEYRFDLKSCHTYENNTIIFDTDSDSNEIQLVAVKHMVTLNVGASKNYGDLVVIVNDGITKTVKGPLLFENGKYLLQLSMVPEEKLLVIPQSDELYFNPPMLYVYGSSNCIDLGEKFIAEKGKVFRGSVVPALSGVVITVETENSESLMDETDAEGKYKFPPLDDSKTYKITAKKDSYVLVGPNEDGNFLAHKLAEVLVEVVDQVDNTPLQGALISLSGGESYRRNLQTNENGIIAFQSLRPSQYFLRPMMKEYSFEPNSKMIDVAEGSTVNVNLRGKRVAYSVFGEVTSLNGEPEDGMIVMALGTGNCSQFSEESTSESNGQFRIRGLVPYCSYDIKVKGSVDDKQLIERSSPTSLSINVNKQDVTNIKFIIFRPTANTDILVRVYTANPDHYKSLRVKLHKESSATNVIIKVDVTNYKITKDSNPGVLVQVPSVMLDEQSYYVQLESTLPQAASLKPQTHYFVANSSFKYFDLEFSIKSSATEQQIKQTSVWTLVLMFGCMFAVYNIDYVAQFLRDRFKFNISNVLSLIKSKPVSTDYTIDKNEIDQMVQNINATKRKVKPKKI